MSLVVDDDSDMGEPTPLEHEEVVIWSFEYNIYYATYSFFKKINV